MVNKILKKSLITGIIMNNFNGQIVYPEKRDSIENALIFLHGYGANADDLINIGQNGRIN